MVDLNKAVINLNYRQTVIDRDTGAVLSMMNNRHSAREQLWWNKYVLEKTTGIEH